MKKEDFDMLTEDDMKETIMRLLSKRGKRGATEDELSLYVDLERSLRRDHALQTLIEKSGIDVAWDEKIEDYVISVHK